METKLERMEERIKRIKAELAEVGEMRPGSLTRQKRGEAGTYYQLSYTHMGKGRTEYIRPESAPEIKKQIANYRRFKKLTEKWVNLEIERSKTRMELEKKKAT